MPEIGTTVLLAEDDLTLSEMYEERLHQDGFTVVIAHNGQEAIDLVDSVKPAVIVLDIMMPKLSGLDVLTRMKDQEETKSIPIIILTALVQEIDRIKELLGPRDSYLVKSEIMPGEVIERIKKAVESQEVV